MKNFVVIFTIAFLAGCIEIENIEINVPDSDSAKKLTENITESTEENENREDKEDLQDYLPANPFESREEGWKKRIDAVFAEQECPPPKPHNPEYYSGPLIDTHFHIAHIPDSDPRLGEEDFGDATKRPPILGVDFSIPDIVCALDYDGTQSVFSFFPVFPQITGQHLEITKRTLKKYPGRFTPFIMPPDGDDKKNGSPTVNAQDLNEMLSAYPGMFEGYGEIGLYERRDGSKKLAPDSQRLGEIYPVVRKNNLIVYFHLGEGQRDEFEMALKTNRDINFIWHGDQLIKYENGRQNLENVEYLLENNPNVYYGIDELYGDVWLLRPEVSKEEFFEHFRNYEPLLEKDLGTWKDFIERHPDQVIWGTDRGAGIAWSTELQVGWVLSDYARAFIARLDQNVQEKFAYKNAQKLIAGAEGR